MTSTDNAPAKAEPSAQTQNAPQKSPSGPAIVLARPQMGENIGAAARVMANFGLADLRVVAPRDGWPSPKAQAMAAGALGDHEPDGTPRPGPVMAQVFETLGEAVRDLRFVLAATARPRELEKPVFAPEAAITHLTQAAPGAQTGVVFGPEASGLTNEEIGHADAIVTYPVDPGFPSLNLAQSVCVFAYAWRAHGASDAQTAFDREIAPALKGDFDGLMAHLEQALENAHYFHPKDKQPLMMRHMRAAFARAGLTEQEVRTLRGALKALEKGPRKHATSADD